MQQQLKKITSSASVFLAGFLLPAMLFFISCNSNTNSGGVVIQVPNDTSALGKIDHFIPLSEIKEYQAAFARERDSLLKCSPNFSAPFSEAFNKKAIIEILQIPGCVGIKVLYGVKQNGDSSSMRLILVGVNSQGDNLYLDDNQQRSTAASETAAKKDTAAPAQAAKMASKMPGDTTGGIEQGQCDPPCRNY